MSGWFNVVTISAILSDYKGRLRMSLPTTTLSANPTRLPSEVQEYVFGYLDGISLCRTQAASHRFATTLAGTQGPWRRCFLATNWPSLATQALRSALTTSVSLVNDAGAAHAPPDFKALLRDAFLRERGAVVVELGNHTHKVGVLGLRGCCCYVAQFCLNGAHAAAVPRPHAQPNAGVYVGAHARFNPAPDSQADTAPDALC